jgi:hypothetical protein
MVKLNKRDTLNLHECESKCNTKEEEDDEEIDGRNYHIRRWKIKKRRRLFSVTVVNCMKRRIVEEWKHG